MQITRVAHSCRPGNKAEFVLGSYRLSLPFSPSLLHCTSFRQEDTVYKTILHAHLYKLYHTDHNTVIDLEYIDN